MTEQTPFQNVNRLETVTCTSVHELETGILERRARIEPASPSLEGWGLHYTNAAIRIIEHFCSEVFYSKDIS